MNAMRFCAGFLLLCGFLSGPAGVVWGETFRYRYQAGQQYRIISQVFQDFSLNGEFVAKTNQLNRMLVTIDKVDGSKGWHSVDYQNSLESRIANEAYQYDRERNYKAEFWRDATGLYTIDPQYFVPPVRNVPIFPERDLKVGESWSAAGYEVQDFRTFGLPDPLVYTMPVNYTWVGKATWQGKELDQIKIDYNIFYRFPKLPSKSSHPVQVSGYSHQKLYWDNEMGRPVAYEEEYFIEMRFSNGQTAAWEGTANARAEDIVAFAPDALAQVKQQVADLALPDVTVRQDDKGITLSIENIQFAPDSARLMPVEQAKLDRIATILARFPDRHLLVTGHTAQAGYAPGRQQLSEDRAKSVGQYLIDTGVRTKTELMFQGMGDRQALADNATEEGRARNRRVEITILNE